MYFHYQDLNDEPIKRYWKHARFWLGRLKVCWCLPTEHIHFSFGVNGGDSNNELTFSFACKLLAVWISFKAMRFHFGHWSSYLDKPIFLHEEREFDLSWHDAGLWLMVWGDPMGDWTRGMAWWTTSKVFHPMDFFFGRNKYTERVLENGETFIPMTEGCYEAKYKLFVSEWSRPRWPFKKELQRITLDVPRGIPTEGKGENSWDCGEDATFGITCMARTLEQGVGELVGSVLRDRKRHGVPRGIKPVIAELRKPV